MQLQLVACTQHLHKLSAVQVRRLICQALAKLYLAGDQLPLYSRVSSFQLFLGTREAFRCGCRRSSLLDHQALGFRHPPLLAR